MKNMVVKGLKILANEGLITFLFKVQKKVKSKYSIKTPYYQWIKENEKDIKIVEHLEYNPTISVIVPVYNVLEVQLVDCIESVISQTYKNWELCLVDDASTWESVRKILKKYESLDKIKIIYRKENGHISTATNDGINISTGEFVTFLDCDDILSTNALYEMVKKLNENHNYDFIYSDEDKITEDGRVRHMPHFKPDWSPDTLMSHMYTCHLSMYRKSIVQKIGGMRIGFEGSQDYDFVLRFTEETQNIGHIPKVLYHWRERIESTAINPESKPYILEAARKSKEEALVRRGLKAKLELIDSIYQYRVNYICENKPLVSIIIYTQDNFEVFNKCINDVKEITNYEKYEVIVIDNSNDSNNKLNYNVLCKQNNYLYHYEEISLERSTAYNIGAELSNGDILLFINDSIKTVRGDWLDRLIGQVTLSHIGAVGAKILYSNTSIIENIGIVNSELGPINNLSGCDDNNIYYFGKNIIDYNYCAISGDCLIVQKNKFNEVAGFNNEYSDKYYDIDFCFKLIEAGYFNIIRTDVILYHIESNILKNDRINYDNELKIMKLYEKHSLFIGKDPFYNPNLTQIKSDYSINVRSEQIFSKTRELEKFILANFNQVPIEYCIDSITVGNTIRIEGWSFNKKSYYPNLDVRSVILLNEDEAINVSTFIMYRPDVTNAYGNKKNLNMTGFYSNINKSSLKHKKYKILLSNRSVISSKKIIVDTKKILEI